MYVSLTTLLNISLSVAILVSHLPSLIGLGVKLTQSGTNTMMIGITDAPVVSFGVQDAYPIPTNTSANLAYGASSVLWDNLWGTNYSMFVIGHI